MQMPAGIVAISVIQWLIFIASIYLLVFLHMSFKDPLNAFEVIFTAMQTANLVLLAKCLTGRDSIMHAGAGSGSLLYAVQVALILLLIIRFARLLRKALARRRNSLTPQSIRETIDFLPGGICFAAPNGKPILTNRRMNELIYMLNNRTVLDVHAVWEELQHIDAINGCEKLEKLSMPSRPDSAPLSSAAPLSGGKLNDSSPEDAPHPFCGEEPLSPGLVDDMADSLFFKFPDSSIWRFRKAVLTDSEPNYIQLDAAEITELYRYSKELYDNNLLLAGQYERQRSLLANIVEINHEKEILSTKMRIHDDLGRSILATKQHLANGTVTENTPILAKVWMNAVRSMEDYTNIHADNELSPEIELRRAADMIGCRIDFRGDRPSQRKTALLFYAAVREALTNAVMHAKADRLIVDTKPGEHGYHVEISDNGTSQVSSVIEGSGLGNLRRRLEQEGAALHIKCGGGVALIIELPSVML